MKELEQLRKEIHEVAQIKRSEGRWQVAAWVSVIVMVAAIVVFLVEVTGR
jgi:hypothetical protein